MRLTHYELLEISQSATTMDIEAAYSILQTMWHPQQTQCWAPIHMQGVCAVILGRLELAYTALVDVDARREYELSLTQPLFIEEVRREQSLKEQWQYLKARFNAVYYQAREQPLELIEFLQRELYQVRCSNANLYVQHNQLQGRINEWVDEIELLRLEKLKLEQQLKEHQSELAKLQYQLQEKTSSLDKLQRESHKSLSVKKTQLAKKTSDRKANDKEKSPRGGHKMDIKVKTFWHNVSSPEISPAPNTHEVEDRSPSPCN